MRRALAKRLIPLLMVLVLVIPYFAVSYYDVYGDDKQNLNDANSKKKDLQSQYEQTEKIIEDLKAQNVMMDMETVSAVSWNRRIMFLGSVA